MKNENQLTAKRKSELTEFCKRVELKFKNIELLEQAFHHRSLTNEKKNIKNNYGMNILLLSPTLMPPVKSKSLKLPKLPLTIIKWFGTQVGMSHKAM